MTKRAVRPKDRESDIPTVEVRRPNERAAKSAGADASIRPSDFSSSLLGEAPQAFSSEEQALSFLLNSVTEKLGSGNSESAQLHEFLKLVLETDPELKEQVLSGITIRK